MRRNRLAELRRELKLTQKQLSDKLNITRASLSHYEVNRRDPDTDTLKKLADFFDVSVDYLLCRTDIRDTFDKAISYDNNTNNTTDSYKDELPQEAHEELLKYMEFLKHKYGKRD